MPYTDGGEVDVTFKRNLISGVVAKVVSKNGRPLPVPVPRRPHPVHKHTPAQQTALARFHRVGSVKTMGRYPEMGGYPDFYADDYDPMFGSMLSKAVKKVTQTVSTAVSSPGRAIAALISAPVSLVSKSAGASLKKSVVGVSKIGGAAAFGVKKGLTASQLKKASLTQKVGLTVLGGAAAFVVAPALIAAAAAKTGLAGLAGSIATPAGVAGALGKFGPAYTALHQVRQMAGLPPITPETFAKSVADQKAANPAMSDDAAIAAATAALDKQMTPGSVAAVNEEAAYKQDLVPADQVPTPQTDAEAKAAAYSKKTSQTMGGVSTGLGGMLSSVPLPVWIGVAALGAILLLRRKR